MLLPTSAEFVELCHTQLWLLVQSLGASAGVVYLTEAVAVGAETRLVRIAAAPEGAMLAVGTLGAGIDSPDSTLARLPAPSPSQGIATIATLPDRGWNERSAEGHRLVLPLMHESMVLGLLVTERNDRGWTAGERQQVERIIQTLSLACVLDKRSQWWQQQQSQQQQLQGQQHDLMDNLVHQFRNPLTALRTFGKLLLKRLPEDDRNREAAASIVRESDRLQELLLQIDRAIDLNEALPDAVSVNVPVALPVNVPVALPRAGTLGELLELKPCDLRAILQPLVVSAGLVAQEKPLALHTEFAAVIPLVQANASALREVLSNLIDNAVKYTPAGGEVHIRLVVEAGQVAVWVTDNGAGIPDGDLAQLFQRHFRGVQAATEIPGTGLGLAIARELMQQMQGDIQVFSPLRAAGWLGDRLPECRGVTFVVTLAAITADRVTSIS
jgi:signal transduction histidine kinase